MSHAITLINAATLAIVLAYTLYFLTNAWIKSRAQRAENKLAEKARSSLFGITLQLTAYSMPFVFFLLPDDALHQKPELVRLLISILGLATGIAAVSLSAWSVYHLGKQWSIVARTRQDHVLIDNGPYAYVRHPIYTARFMMLAAALLAVTDVKILVPALLAFLVGTMIRVQKEELLLRSRFGASFDAYVQAVPAVVPVPWKRPASVSRRQVA
jgi:protein-S-isoprenylcysteine O-methyltransferase Ste14